MFVVPGGTTALFLVLLVAEEKLAELMRESARAPHDRPLGCSLCSFTLPSLFSMWGVRDREDRGMEHIGVYIAHGSWVSRVVKWLVL